jgi:hypothetical protein
VPPERERPAVLGLIGAVLRRRVHIDAAEAGAFGLVAAAVCTWIASAFVDMASSVMAGAVIGGTCAVALFWFRRRCHTSIDVAHAIETLRPNARNLVITAEELHRHPQRASEWMTLRVTEDASRAVQGLAAATVAPGRRAVLSVCGALAVCLGLSLLPSVQQTQTAVVDLARSVAAAVVPSLASTLTVTVHPPPYSELPEQTLKDPDRLEVLEGSRLDFAFSGPQTRLRQGTVLLGTLRTGEQPLAVVARDSGYFALEQDDSDKSTRLIALTVLRDRSPVVKIEQPARDLLLPTADRAIPIRITASDDLGLATLELRYTKVSGSGEQFEFREGTLPLRLHRGSAREWSADSQMALAQLELQPGDSLVYRAVGHDRRPGDIGLGASDTFFVEIAGPGQVPLEGIEMPPDEERYALSQQMIVLKIERLKARERNLPREALVEEAALLAAEQRSVRANFVFLLGGHVEDEEVEAEQSTEIAEGRLQNTARRDINAAIGHMTRAEQGLVAATTSAALPPARAAVEALQRAFGRSRYLLRTLQSRTPLDPARRLTGNISTAAPWWRTASEPEQRPGDAVRRLLADLVQAYGSLESPRGTSIRFDRLAEEALAVNPASPHWQQIARAIANAHRSNSANARPILDEVIQQISRDAGAGLVPDVRIAVPTSPLERAWRGGIPR